MAYAHAAWRSKPTPEEKLAELNLFLDELQSTSVDDIAADGFSKGTSSRADLIKTLLVEAQHLEKRVAKRGGMITRIRRKMA